MKPNERKGRKERNGIKITCRKMSKNIAKKKEVTLKAKPSSVHIFNKKEE